jgi:putative aldouronate transport system substrate-binding protein
MRKTKKSIVVLSLLTMLLAACSGNNGANNPSPSPQATDTDAATNKGPLSLSIQARIWGQAPPADNEFEKELEKRTNTSLDYQWVPTEQYKERLNVKLASRDLADLTVVLLEANSTYPSQVYSAIQGGAALDLTPYIEDKEFMKDYEALGSIPQEYWDLLKVDGKIYGIPKNVLFNRLEYGGVNVRQDLLEANNLTAPKTTDELKDVLVKLTNAPGMYGLSFDNDNFQNNNMAPLAAAFTGAYTPWTRTEEGFVYRDFMPEYKDFLSWANELYQAKALNPEFALKQAASGIKKGKGAISIASVYDFTHIPDFNVKYFEDGVAEQAKIWGYPQVEGPKGAGVILKDPFDEAWMISSSFNKDDIPQLFEWFEYMASEEYKEFASFPLEGVYHTVENGVKVQNEKYASESIWIYQPNQSSAIKPAEPWQFTAAEQYDQPELAARLQEQDQASRALEEKFNIENPALGIASPTFSKEWVSLTKDLNSNSVKVVMGAMSLEDWDKYVQSITSTDAYKQMVAEFEEGYASKQG